MAKTAKPTDISTWGITPRVRGALRSFVLSARRALEDDFQRQLVAAGVRPEGAVEPPRGLEPDAAAAREAALAVIGRAKEAGLTSEEAVETFVRDSAFTFLNRMVGLRCLEERGMLLVDGNVETAIRQDARLSASSLYFRTRNELPSDAGARDVWRVTLDRAFRAVSERIGLLFDPDSEYGRLFPLQATLKELTEGLNDPAIPGEVWADDEVLGWVYQYYNAEEKDKAYDQLAKGGKLERPEELAAASCLYTERYMVDFLLQNTLGALWTEMHPDTGLPDTWPYFARPPEDRRTRTDVDVPERLRDLTLLDPACGSGHFLARAFDLLVEMYREEGLEREDEIARLIIGRNLHGIDIDLRAVQITALRLYLKGCELAGPGFRPERLNLVATDVTLPAAPPAELLERFRGDRDVGDLLEGVWSELRDAPKLGSLLHPERRVRELLTRRRAKGPTLEHQDDEAWERFGIELLESIREEFERQAETQDIGQRLFGKDLVKGMSLVEALARRYDVVVTNPPYAGSKNLDAPVKAFIEREYKDGKRDLYAAFILRCVEFARFGGSVGMVTQQSWLFLRSFAKLRGAVLNGTAVTTLAHLGEHGFEEAAAAGAFVALFTLRTHGPAPDHRMTAFRLIGPKSPAEKDHLLRRAIAGSADGIVSTPKQSDLQAIPETPFVYWLRPRFFELLRSDRRLSDAADVCVGLQTSDNERFIRWSWEVSLPRSSQGRDASPGRWFPVAKGGRYQRWAGLEQLVVDWEQGGERIKQHIVERYPYLKGNYGWLVRDEDKYFDSGLTYSLMARGSLGARALERSIFDNASPSIFPMATEDQWPLAALLNSHTVSYLLRITTQDLKFREGYVSNLPLPVRSFSELSALGNAGITLKRELVAGDACERSFDPPAFLSYSSATCLMDMARTVLTRHDAIAAVLHTLEEWNERLVFTSYRLDEGDVQSVFDETGTPAGCYPMIAGYDELPEAPAGVELPDGLAEHHAGLERQTLSTGELESLKARLRELYVAGPGAKVEEPDTGHGEDGGSEEAALGAHIPIPTETFLGELSQKLQVHPVSVYNLLEELHAEGVYSPPEVRRFMEDWVSVALLLMLGYRWPEQDRYEAEAGPAIDEDLIDADGIIPLVPCDDQPTVADRLRTLLERRFGEGGAARSLEEFETWMGRDLQSWLERDFFARHVQRFKQRPIAWHLTSPEGTFQALVLYHRLSRETLRRLRDVYAGALINRLRAELQRAERRKDASQAQELRLRIEDVEEFRERISAIEEGRELMYRIRCRWKGEEASGRPGPYAPDIDDGVKVNIRPFQETGVLARTVIRKW